MPTHIGTRVAGPAVRLTCNSAASATNASVAAFGNDIAAWAEFLNVGAYPVMLVVGPTSAGLPTPAFPASLAGTVAGSGDRSVSEFVLPAGMTAPAVHPVPTGLKNSSSGFWFNGITLGSAGTQASDVFVTPIVAQS